MIDLVDWLWLHTWWSFAESEDPLHAWVYRGINLVEGACWLGFTAAVIIRRARQPKEKRSTVEWWYALAFFVFGLTDFREAVALQSWLIWLKLANLIVLLVLRRKVMKTLYPESKVY